MTLTLKQKIAAATAAAALALTGVAVVTASSATADTQRATPPKVVFAVVNVDGSLLRGKAAATSSRLGTGLYDVRFNRNITNCAWNATIGLGTFSGTALPGFLTVVGLALTTNGLMVSTFGTNGAIADRPFLVVVNCK